MRPTSVKRYAALLATLLVLGACGARPSGGSAATPASSGATTAGCFTASAPLGATAIDLDGDGRGDRVVFARGKSGCTGLLATVGSTTRLTKTGSLRPASFRAVTVPGRKGQLLVARETHPRGGFQDHLFAYADGRLVELTLDGHPLFPFVATDTPGSALGGFSASCADGGISVTRAVTHQPVGLAPAFDVVATTYRIVGTALTASSSRRVADKVHDGRLVATHPELTKHSVLTQGCR